MCGPLGVPFLALIPLLDPLIERLHHSRIHRGNYINCGIQFFFRHPRFPCVRKAAVHSRIAEPHHRDGKTDQHLLAVGQALDGMRIAVKSSEICFCHCRCSFLSPASRVARPASGIPKTQNPRY